MSLQELGVINRMVEFIIDRIVAFTDYFVVTKHVTLSETALFCLSLLLSAWIGVFGLGTTSLEVVGSAGVWFGVFFFLSLFHFATFLAESRLWRTVAVCLHAMVWCFVAVLSILDGARSASLPGLIVLVFTSTFIAVRLYRDKMQGV